MDSITNPRKRSRSPDRFLPPISRLAFDERRSYAGPGPTSVPRFPETSSPNGSNPSHFSSRTPPPLNTAFPPPQGMRQSQQSLPSLSEVMGAPGPLKSMVPGVPGGLVGPNHHHHSYSAPGSQTTSPHPSHPDQRPRPYEDHRLVTNDLYHRQQPQYPNGYSTEPRLDHPRYPPNASPLTPSHSSSPYGSAPSQYSHDQYRGPEQHFMKKDNGMSTSIPPYGPSAEKALAHSAMKQGAQYCTREFIPLLEQFCASIRNLDQEGSIEDVIVNCDRFLEIHAPRFVDVVRGTLNEARDYALRCQHANAIPEPRGHYHSQPARGSPHQYTKEVEQELLDEQQRRFTQPDQKRARRGRAAPPGRCHSCNRSETPEWRRGPDGARTLCNACGLHFAKISRKNQKNNGVAAST